MKPGRSEAPSAPDPVGIPSTVQACLFVLLAVSAISCTPADSLHTYLTFTTSHSTFSVTVEGKGTLEAKTSQTLSTPNIRWHQPEISYLAPEGSHVKKGDVVVTFDSEQLERDHLKASNDLELSRADAKKKEAELNMQRLLLESEMKSSEAAAEISRLQVAKLEFVAPRLQKIKRLEMTRAELRAKKIRQKLASLDAIQKEERAHKQIKIKQAQRKLKQTQTFLDRLVLKAPVDGIVVREKNWRTGNKVQEGETVYANMPVAKIPDLSVMQVKMQVGEIAAQKLKKGQRARITVSSAGDLSLPGKVSRVARRAKPVKKNSKVKQVEVIAEIDSSHAAFMPGLSARATIIVEEQPDALVVPLECIFERDSLNVVYVREKDTFVPREVTIAAQNANFAVIEGRLNGGEKLSLREPAASLVR